MKDEVPIMYKITNSLFLEFEKADKDLARKLWKLLNDSKTEFLGIRYPTKERSFSPEVEREMYEISPVWFEFQNISENVEFLVPIRGVDMTPFRIFLCEDIGVSFRIFAYDNRGNEFITNSIDSRIMPKFREAKYIKVINIDEVDNDLRRIMRLFSEYFLVFKWESYDYEKMFFYIPILSS